MAKKRGLIDRMMLGKEKSEGYARASLPSNRWELFWDIFKGRFGKLCIVNLLMLIFFIPLALLIFMYVVFLSNLGATYPFMQPFGVGYLAPPTMDGVAELVTFRANVSVFLFLPIAAMIAGVGFAGGAYVIRNMVWTEGIFVSNDFWRGIKINVKSMLAITALYSLVFYITLTSTSMIDYVLAMGVDNAWLFKVAKVFSYVILFVFSIMTMHMITMATTYDLKLRHLIKNSFLFTIGLLPQNLFFLVCGFIPFILLMFGSMFLGLGIILILIMGLSLLLLVWTNYSQWAYDKFINDKVEGAQKNRGIYEKIKESDSGALKQYRQQLAMVARSSLNSKPIKPITDDELKLVELPTSFNRNDLENLRRSKEVIYEDHEKYVEEHKNDPEFMPTEAEKQLQEQEKERLERIEKAKKALSKRNKL